MMNDTLILSLKLKSGDFASELHIPVPKTTQEQDKAVERWLDFMASGFRICAEKMDAVLTEEPTRGDL
jgi:DNA polymerase IIIc chi subunit